jgi:hypothetical protein
MKELRTTILKHRGEIFLGMGGKVGDREEGKSGVERIGAEIGFARWGKEGFRTEMGKEREIYGWSGERGDSGSQHVGGKVIGMRKGKGLSGE